MTVPLSKKNRKNIQSKGDIKWASLTTHATFTGNNISGKSQKHQYKTEYKFLTG